MPLNHLTCLKLVAIAVQAHLCAQNTRCDFFLTRAASLQPKMSKVRQA